MSSLYGIDLPGDAGFETLAGFLLHQFGYIPVAGESVIHDGRVFLVQSMDRNRIARVKIISPQPPDPAPPAGGTDAHAGNANGQAGAPDKQSADAKTSS